MAMLSHIVQFQRKLTPELRTEQPHFTEEKNDLSCSIKVLRNRHQNPKFPVGREKKGYSIEASSRVLEGGTKGTRIRELVSQHARMREAAGGTGLTSFATIQEKPPALL